MGLIRVKNKTKINEEVIYMQYGPDPNAVYPNEAIKSVCFILKLVDCLEKCLIYGHIRRFAN